MTDPFPLELLLVGDCSAELAAELTRLEALGHGVRRAATSAAAAAAIDSRAADLILWAGGGERPVPPAGGAAELIVLAGEGGVPPALAAALARIAAERRAEAAEARLAALVAGSPVAILGVSAEGRVTRFNPAAEKTFGWSAEAALGQPLEVFLEGGREGLATIEEDATRALRGLRQDGSEVSLEVSLSPRCRDASGAFTLFAQDVSRRREAEDHLRTLIETEPECVKLVDAEARLLDMNAAGLRMIEAPDLEAVRNRNILPLIAPEHRDAYETFNRDVCNGTPGQLEFEIVSLGGRRRWLHTHAVPFRLGREGRVVQLAITRDVTDARRTAETLRATEAQLLQAQKLEAVGRLAGGVAHDFNNLLTVILSYTELALEALPGGIPMRTGLQEVRTAARRGATLTRQLLAFSRRQVFELRIMDLNSVVGDMERMLLRLLGEDVTLVTRLEPRLGRIRCDPGQIEQVIANLAVNARDAMPRGGKLLIETANVAAGPADPSSPAGSSLPRVLLSVSDTGCGMDEVTLSRIFEPFFTTRPVGQGSGLGLATVYGIVKQSDGHIEVESRVGKGSTFRIYLPRVDLDGAVDPAPATEDPEAPARRETVLVVEDEEVLRRLAAEVLEQAGYTVLEAPSGRAALGLIDMYPGPIHLVVSDVVMPEMGGVEFVAALRRRRPETRVLFVSGYADAELTSRGGLDREEFLHKPFRPVDLRRKVREVLGRG